MICEKCGHEDHDAVHGRLWRAVVYIANTALDKIASLETTAEDAKDGFLEACERARDASKAIHKLTASQRQSDSEESK